MFETIKSEKKEKKLESLKKIFLVEGVKNPGSGSGTRTGSRSGSALG
jgi:hypothetical protein